MSATSPPAAPTCVRSVRHDGRHPFGSLAGRLLGVLTVLLVVAGCTEPDPEPPPAAIDHIQVVGEFGARPQVIFETPLEIAETDTTTVIEGTGPTLADGDLALVSYLAVDATTGEVVGDIYGSQPQTMQVNEASAGPLYEELAGAAEGSRLLRVELGTAADPDPVVIVYDVLHTRAWGEPVDPPEDAPSVSLDEDGAPSVEIPDGDAPTELRIVTLKRGEGAQVQAEYAVTVRYTAVSWDTGEVVDGTWSEGQGPTTIAFTGLIEGWQDGLVDATVGSQVMLIVPPEQAFGDDTLVYVIDVLAVSPMDGTEGESE
ncbi:FKBP-type peptidyl-prolyl cis-trans isomerase [Ruania halotolerans]|uniref:FKBP-type peptidyl-prolyl cis-trans isomerase n=1 Tax=Ruania halotolerans TaxID=2897773 RepID=UPI001E3B7D60|nr:FKBP-type peptidyl-prolyl cis-trans isomerase [Ruania halotolerans]UFU08083.1 FKBP-type peptidyl-prolyl cis-trans isomerase [Ruania halotolerans]